MGDRWSLVILRDMMFGGKRHYRELLTGSMECIASNVLADRMKHLVELGMLTKTSDPTHKQKAIYSLTEMAIELVPVIAALGAWGSKWLPVTHELSIRAAVLGDGGTRMWERFMADLRAEHLGAPPRRGRTVREDLTAAYVAAVANKG